MREQANEIEGKIENVKRIHVCVQTIVSHVSPLEEHTLCQNYPQIHKKYLKKSGKKTVSDPHWSFSASFDEEKTRKTEKINENKNIFYFNWSWIKRRRVNLATIAAELSALQFILWRCFQRNVWLLCWRVHCAFLFNGKMNVIEFKCEKTNEESVRQWKIHKK